MCMSHWFTSVQFSSVAQLCPTLCKLMVAARQASLSITNSQSLLKLMSIELWCHPTISSSVIPFSSCLQSFPASGSFQMSQFFASGGQSIAQSIQLQHQSFQWIFRTDFLEDWLVGSPCSPRDSRESSPTPQFKSINSSALSFLYSPTLSSIHDLRKTIALIRQTFVGKVMSLLFNMLSRLGIAFLPRSIYLLISWLQSPSAVILEPKKINSLSVSIFSQSICHEVMGLDAMILVFWMLF